MKRSRRKRWGWFSLSEFFPAKKRRKVARRRSIFESLEQRLPLATSADLIKDINIATNGGGDPQWLTPVSDTLMYFTADDGTVGRELWRTDGTAQGTLLVSDIRVGGGSSTPQNLININGQLFFTADDGLHGREVWSVSGNSAILTKDVLIGPGTSGPAELTNVNGTLYFAADDGGTFGRELWSTSSPSDAQLVKDVNPGTSGSFPNSLVNVNGTLFLAMNDGSTGNELWTVRGTTVQEVADINPGPFGSDPTNGGSVGGNYFFYATDGTDVANELWFSDGTCAGTHLVQDINNSQSYGYGYGFNNGQSNVQNIVDLNGIAIFSATDPAIFQELRESDGVNVFSWNLVTGDGDPQQLTVTGNYVFYTYDETGGLGNGTARELYYTDGFFAGRVKDIFPGVNNGSNPQWLTNAQGTLYFAANNGTNGNELWRSNGTSAGTVLDFDLNKTPSISANSDPQWITYFNGYVYFSATDGTSVGRELYRVKAIAPNSAPVLNNTGNPFLTSFPEDTTSGFGTSIPTLITSDLPNMITDADAGAQQGIALTAVDSVSGTWEFSTNGGGSWTAVSPSVSDTNALLLASSGLNRLRFIPNADYFGTIPNAITFRAWDQFRGSNGTYFNVTPNGGATAFSLDSETASITVTPVADTPPSTAGTTQEDTLSPPIIITPNVVDGNSVTYFRVTNIIGGTLYQADGVTLITSGTFITAAQAQAGVTFLPSANSFAGGSFIIQASTSNLVSGLGGNLVTIPVNVSPVADPPSVTAATTNEDTQSTSGLVITRNVVDGIEIGFFKITNINGGTLYQNDGVTVINNGDFITIAQGGAGLKFTPSPNSTVNGTFNVQGATSSFGSGLGAATLATITVNAVNDPPVLTVPGLQIGLIGTDFPFSIATNNPVTMADIDGGTGIEQVRIVANLGTINLPGAIGDGTNTVTVNGTLTAINAALNTMSYRPPNASFTGAVMLTATANDQGNTGSGGPQIDTKTINLVILPPNQAPVLTVPASTQVFNEDTVRVFSSGTGNQIRVSDADAGANPLIVTLIASGNSGTLTLSNIVNSTVTGNGTATLQITGSQTDIISSLNSLTYSPLLNFNGSATIQVSANDQGYYGYGGPLSASAIINLSISAINDAPVNSIPATATTVEDEAMIFSAANSNLISVSDVDSGAGNIRVRLTAANGSVSVLAVGGVTISPSNNVPQITLTGTVNSIRSALASVTYTPNAGFHGTDTITMLTNDLGNTGAPGALTDTDTVSITVLNLNKPPVQTVPSSQSSLEDTTVVFTGATQISVTDPDSGNAPIVTTLTTVNGIMTLPSTTGLTVTNNGSSLVTLQGDVATISARLNNVVFTPNPNFAGIAVVTIATNDLGNSGVGGPKTDSDSITISITPVNDAPVNNLPTTQDTGINSPLIFNSSSGNGINVADVDAGNGLVRVNLAATDGNITLGSVIGVVASGNGTPNVQVTGNLTALNLALNNLQFVPNTGFQGVTTITMTTNDQGNSGLGGPLTDMDTITIKVRPALETEGTTLYVTGTTVDDVMTLVFTSTTSYIATINGNSYNGDTSTISSVRFNGGVGNDQLTVTDSSAASTASFSPFNLSLTSATYTAVGSLIEKIYVTGSTNDQALFADSAGDDVFTAQQTISTMTGSGYLSQANGFGSSNATAGKGGFDVALLYDDAGNDSFYSYSYGSAFVGPNISYAATAFDQVYAFALNGGTDVAVLVGTSGNDYYFGLPGYSILQGTGYVNEAQGFDGVYAYADTGSDQAVFYDSTGDDVFYGLEGYTLLYSGNNYYNLAFGFGVTTAYASTGNDVAIMFDTTSSDIFTAYPTQAIMTGKTTYQGLNFDQVFAFSSSGGNDIAGLYDSSGNDVFYGLYTHSAMTGSGYFNQAYGFNQVNAYAGNGGSDVAILYDSVGSDFLTAASNYGQLNYPTSRLVFAQRFSKIQAVSSSGGVDTRSVTSAIDYVLETYGIWKVG